MADELKAIDGIIAELDQKKAAIKDVNAKVGGNLRVPNGLTVLALSLG